TEPDAGSDVKNIRTTARRNGNEYVLNGTKIFVTNGVHADLYCVAAKTTHEARPSESISMFLIEKDRPGFRVGKKLEKHGWLSSDLPEWILKIAVYRHPIYSGPKDAGFTQSCIIFRTKESLWARWLWAKRKRRSI